MEKKIYFRNTSGNNLEDLLKTNDDLIKVYLKVDKKDKTTVLSLSKEKGDYLYILSNTDYQDLYKYFEEEKETNKPEIEEPISKVKRYKQTNLFDLFKKKQ